MAGYSGVGALTRLVKAIAVIGLIAPVLSACSGGGDVFAGLGGGTSTKFSSAEYGVAASPRVSFLGTPPRGGGRYQVGQPYQVRGRWYHPAEDPDYVATGSASWYGPNFHGRQTANGEVFDQYALSAAHPTLPLPSYVRVTNIDNGNSVLVRVNDRGPFAHDRVIDLSRRTAEVLGFIDQGVARVNVQYVGRAPLEGDDTQFLLASLNRTTVFEQDMGSNGLRVASAQIAPQPAQRRTLVNTFNNIFSYAGSGATPETGSFVIDSSLAAAEAMASQPGALAGWQASMDIDARDIDIELGVFPDPAQAHEIARKFALLGAVDEASEVGGTRLTLTYLKPGASPEDVAALGSDLGLATIVLY